MSSSRVISLTEFGGYDKLQIEVVECLLPDDNSVTIEVKACGMNFSDIHVRQGVYTFHGVKPPFVMGQEAAGFIAQVGKNVVDFKVGDRVLCWNFNYGLWSEFVTIRASQCFLIPDEMTFHEAAAIPVNYVTAYEAVKGFGGLAPGQSILIQSAGGGVGWAATQIAKSIEDVTIFGTASKEKHELIKENGVQHTIDYRNLDFVTEVLSISPSGVNVVLDCLSGADFMRSRQLLKHMGRLIHIGICNMITGEKRNLYQMIKVWWQVKHIKVVDLIIKNHAICGLNIATLNEEDPSAFKSAMQEILNLYKSGKIKPRIDSIWTFEQIHEASDHMVKRKNIGKIILVP